MTDILLKRTTGDVYFSTPINEGAKRVRKLMADDYLSLPISTYEPLDIRLGDYVDIPNEGRFCIIETQYPSVSEESNSYDYELKFEAQYRKFANKIFKFHPQSGASECSWKLTANIEVHVEQVLKAMNALGNQSPSYYYNGSLEWETHIDSTIDIDVAKFISYDNINILDGISAIAETFECEWWVTDNVLHFGRCEFGDTYIEISRELNAVNISRSDTNEKTANRIYPFGSTENLPPKYNKSLVFDVTNIYGASDSDYPDQIAIYDAQRPLTHEWFDSSLWKVDEDTREIIYGVEESGSTSIVENDKEGKMVNIALHMFPLNSASFGKNKIILKAFRPYVNASENLDGGGQFATFPTLTIRGLYSYTLKDDEDGKTYTEQNPLSVSKVTSSISNGYQLAMEDEEVVFEIPKTIVVDNIEREIDTISDIKIALDYRVKVYNKGVVNWTIYASNDYFVWEAENVKYSVQDVRLNFLNGKLQDEPIKAILDPSFADKGYALVLSNVSSEIVEIGDNFVIANINEKFVPSSYYSYPPSNDDSSNEVINAIADGRLMLSKDKGNYIDAYRYINGEKVFIGEQGYDDAEEMPLEEAIEDVVIFEDVKPDHTFRITNSWYVMEEGKDGDGNPTTTYRFFFNDELFTADNQFNDSYIIEGKELSIRFSSGKLNGMTFGVNYSNNYTLDHFPTEWVESFNNSLGDVDLFLPYIEIDESVKQSLFNLMQSLTNNDMSNNLTCWEIIVDEESHLPSTFYMPEIDDEFTMSGLNVSIIDEQYLPMAEEKLYDVAFGYVKNTNLDASSYDCTMFADVMADGLALPIGQRVLLKENVFFKNGRQSRVIGYEYPLDYPYDNPKYTIGEKASYSRFGDIESKLESIELSVKGQSQNVIINTNQNTGGVGYIIGTNDNVTPESNQNVYSALKSLKEFVSRTKNEVVNYLWRFTKGINIGHFLSGASGATIDSEGNAEVEKLTSRNEIKSQEVISNNIHTTDFAQGALLGSGGAIYQLNGKTYAEVDYLTVRYGMSVVELLIQQYRAIGGSFVVSHANGEIESVYDYGKGYNIWIKNEDKAPRFKQGDLVRCEYLDWEKNEKVHYWVKVDVSAPNVYGREILTMHKTGLNGAVPKVGDKLVQMGNISDTNRQGCILITTENSLPRIMVLDGINKPEIVNTSERTNYKTILGSLDGFTDPYTGKKLSGYGLWGENVHLHGDLILSSTNKSVSDSLKDVGTGRNLLLATNQGIKNWSFYSSLDKGSYSMQEIDYNGAKGVQMKNLSDGSATYEIIYFSLRPQFIKKDKTYHLSFDLMQTANNNVEIDFSVSLSKSDLSNSLNNPIHVSSKDVGGIWRHYNVEFNAIADGEENGGQVVYFSIRPNAREWQDFAIANLKLEEGMKATDWSQAPEDVSTDLADFKTEVGKEFEVSNGKFESIQYKVEGSSSARNLLLKSNEGLQTKNYFMGSYYLGNSKPQKGDVVTLSFTANVFDDRITRFRVFNSGGTLPLQNNISIKEYRKDIKISSTFTWNINDDGNTHINIYQTNDDFERLDDLYGNTIIKNIKLEFGDVATEWSIAPEESNAYTESRIKQTADNIELKVKNGLAETGIDIENKKITVTADDFTIKNNNDKIVASADKFGNWSTNTLITLNDDGTKAITINEEGNRILTHYYPYTNQRQLEEGWNGTSLFRYFDENGVMLWQIGGAKGFMNADYVEWTAVGLYDTGFRFEVEYFESNKMRFTSVGDKELSAYYQHNVDNAIPKMYETKSTNNPLNGWFTNQTSWQPFDSYPEGFEVRIWKRQFIHYTNGVEDWRHQLKWDMDSNEITIL